MVRTYISFNVDLSSDDVTHVSLMLYSRNHSRLGYRVRALDERWREQQITFANAPELPRDFVASGPLRARAWKAVDVTSLVAGEEKYIGFGLATISTKGIEFASRETGLRGPRLIVERESNATTGSTGSSTEELDP